VKSAQSILRLVSFLVLALVGLFALLTSTSARAVSPAPMPPPGTQFVRASAVGANNGTSWFDAWVKLEDAITAAPPGAMIWVAEGAYSPSNTPIPFLNTRTYYINKQLQIYGAFKGTELLLASRWGLAENTILEGNIPASGGNVADHLFTIDTVAGTPGVLIDGFTIQHGNASATGTLSGGGIYAIHSDVDVTGCILRDNRAMFGGGLYFEGGSGDTPKTLHVVSCKFLENTVLRDGGAFFGQELTGDVVNTQFEGNQAWRHGGAAFLWKMPLLPNPPILFGFANCTFWMNNALNLIAGPTSQGGAVHLGEGSSSPLDAAKAQFVNCTFAKNQANGCLPGQAVYVSPSSIGEIYNSILYWNWNNSPTGCGPSTPAIGGNPTVDWSNVENGWTPVANNISGDPVFRGGSPPASGGQQLSLKGATPTTLGSPCIDRSDYGRLPTDVHDLDQDGNTGEKLPVDVLESGRMVDRHGPGEDPNNGTPAPNDYLDMGAFEKP
jgi:hypothetical protein